MVNRAIKGNEINHPQQEHQTLQTIIFFISWCINVGLNSALTLSSEACWHVAESKLALNEHGDDN